MFCTTKHGTTSITAFKEKLNPTSITAQAQAQPKPKPKLRRIKMKNNIYGFDFLQADHNNASTPAEENEDEEVVEYEYEEEDNKKSDLEKQFDVIQFLQTHRSSGCLDPGIIFKSTGVDLTEGGKDDKVIHMLARNPKIQVEEVSLILNQSNK